MSHRKNSQGIFISQGSFLTCIFSAGLWHAKKTFTQLWMVLQKSLQTPESALPDTENSVCEGQKKEWKDFCVVHWSLILMSMGDCQTEKTRLLLEGCDPVCSKVLSSNCVCWSSCLFHYFTQKTVKHVQLLLLPGSKILQQISFFLLGLYKAKEEALEFLLQTHLQEKRKLFWNVLESLPFCFISNCRSEQNKVSFFS